MSIFSFGISNQYSQEFLIFAINAAWPIRIIPINIPSGINWTAQITTFSLCIFPQTFAPSSLMMKFFLSWISKKNLGLALRYQVSRLFKTVSKILLYSYILSRI
jgi:hypothetical protein